MEYRLVENTDQYIHFKITGEYSLGIGKEILGKLVDLCRESKNNKLMVDIREKDGEIPQMDRFFLGEHIAKINFGTSIKLAVIGKKEQINKFSEIVAQNRGTQLKIFSDVKEARKWLLT